MHIPREELRQEMLSTPQFVRFTFPYQDGDKKHPTLIVKANSLLLKYIIQGVPLIMTFFTTSDGQCVYALYIEDDPANGVFLHSIVVNDDEVAAINDLKNHNNCTVYLFNETCTNCAWASVTIKISKQALALVNNSPRSVTNTSLYSAEISTILNQIGSGSTQDVSQSNVSIITDWHSLNSHFILNGTDTAALNLLTDNEGRHQEQIAHVLLGNLSPKGAFLNTMLHEPSGSKEFMDIVLTYKNGTILLESNSLSIFEQRVSLPPRTKLAKNTKKSVKKAIKQLKGAARTLRDNVKIFDDHGKTIELESNQLIHAVILVPDLALLANDSKEWFTDIVSFKEKTGGLLHMLDTVQLFRAAQAAEMIAKASTRSTPMMALDYYLIKRAEIASKYDSINFDMIALTSRASNIL